MNNQGDTLESPPSAAGPDLGDIQAAAKEMGLSGKEYLHIEEALGRPPSPTEIAVFAGMWSEHCSYKSTLQWLRELPTTSSAVIAGPGAHAGAVRVSEEWAVAFKIESHNHPSAVEPYQGAATGVGGILRDIIALGARPCCIMDSLAFGEPTSDGNRYLIKGVVEGIAGYGNAIGIANVGGCIRFDSRYDGNPLVNALAAGMVRVDGLRTAEAVGVGNAVVYVGARTGRDGILGAAFASEELASDLDNIDDRPHVQVGDPFSGRKLMEACLSFTADMGLLACQDMGASGISCAMFEMAAAGAVGIEIDLDTIPLREENMSPQEIMLSESQERFMFVVDRSLEQTALKHFRQHGVEAVVCGRVVAGDRAQARYRGEVVVDLPAALVADDAPLAYWPIDEDPVVIAALEEIGEVEGEEALAAHLLVTLADANIGDKRSVTSHYDQTVGNRTVRGPHQAEAAVLKLPDSQQGFALTLTSRGDLCAADAYLGTQAVLAEALRNLACVGAPLLAITDGLNVASPQNPTENRKLRDVIYALRDGLTALDVPVTGGNCSLYNESPSGPIPPTPMVGAIGLLENTRLLPHGPQAGDRLLFMSGTVAGPTDMDPHASFFAHHKTGQGGGKPWVNLAAEANASRCLIDAIRQGQVSGAKDCGMGGIVVALVKLLLRGATGQDEHEVSPLGAQIAWPESSSSARADWFLFGEPPASYWLTASPEGVTALRAACGKRGLTLLEVGEVGGDHLRWQQEGAILLDQSMSALAHAYAAARPFGGSIDD